MIHAYRWAQDNIAHRYTLPEEKALMSRAREQWVQRAAVGAVTSSCLFTAFTFPLPLRYPIRAALTLCIATAGGYFAGATIFYQTAKDILQLPRASVMRAEMTNCVTRYNHGLQAQLMQEYETKAAAQKGAI